MVKHLDINNPNRTLTISWNPRESFDLQKMLRVAYVLFIRSSKVLEVAVSSSSAFNSFELKWCIAGFLFKTPSFLDWGPFTRPHLLKRSFQLENRPSHCSFSKGYLLQRSSSIYIHTAAPTFIDWLPAAIGSLTRSHTVRASSAGLSGCCRQYLWCIPSYVLR